MNRKELYHHGIKGMKWGVRRYQNADGSLTPAGESRYKRGKRLSPELAEVREKKYQALKKRYKSQIEKYYDEAYFIGKKYGLDLDDGGGGDTDRFTQKQIDRAAEKYLDLFDKVSYLEDRIDREATEKAKAYINKKYGDTAVSDIGHYRTVNAIAATAALVAAYAGAMVLLSKNDKKTIEFIKSHSH